MATVIYLVRHGQSMGNLNRRFLGHTDLDLSPLGYQQAAALKKYLDDITFDAIYSSPLLRAYHTIEGLAKERKQGVVTSQELMEIYAGAWENLTFSDLEAKYPLQYSCFRRDIGMSRPEEGESTLEVGKRVHGYLEGVACAHEGEQILVSTHATAICMFVCEVLGLAPEERKRIALPTNASLTILEYRDGRFILKSYSQDAYLGELKTPTPPLA